MEAATGAVERVGFYALKLSLGEFPTIVDDRLSRFFETAPSYDDEEEMNDVAWWLVLGKE